MRILYLRNKKHQPFIKTNGLALDYVYPNTGSDPYKVKPKRNDGKEDSLLSWLLPSASLQELKHKVKEIAALHKKRNTHKNYGINITSHCIQTNGKSLGIYHSRRSNRKINGSVWTQ
jgi:hypothetical protein